jgi:hypothetical protein
MADRVRELIAIVTVRPDSIRVRLNPARSEEVMEKGGGVICLPGIDYARGGFRYLHFWQGRGLPRFVLMPFATTSFVLPIFTHFNFHGFYGISYF